MSIGKKNGVRVIPNIRPGDERTYELCCTGILKGGTIAVGSHGGIKLLLLFLSELLITGAGS